MPRYPRLLLARYPYHIVQRGHDRQPVFACDEDFAFYLENLAEQKVIFDVRVYAFCLMTNHVHLIVQPDRHGADVSSLMRVVAARQTRYTNQRERRTGTLWESRFKASLIDTEHYLLACGRYVDLNPVRAAMVSQPEDYRWSSFRFRTGVQTTFIWLDPDPACLALGKSRAECSMNYRDFVSANVPADEVNLIRMAVQRNQLTGNTRFVDAISRKIDRRIEVRGPGRPRKPRK